MKGISKRMIALFVGMVALLLLDFVPAASVAAQTCVHPPAELVSWWPADENSNDIQDHRR